MSPGRDPRRVDPGVVHQRVDAPEAARGPRRRTRESRPIHRRDTPGPSVSAPVASAISPRPGRTAPASGCSPRPRAGGGQPLAIARPMPFVDPVTTTTLPVRSNRSVVGRTASPGWAWNPGSHRDTVPRGDGRRRRAASVSAPSAGGPTWPIKCRAAVFPGDSTYEVREFPDARAASRSRGHEGGGLRRSAAATSPVRGGRAHPRRGACFRSCPGTRRWAAW